jgi:hypothetical protein
MTILIFGNQRVVIFIHHEDVLQLMGCIKYCAKLPNSLSVSVFLSLSISVSVSVSISLSVYMPISVSVSIPCQFLCLWTQGTVNIYVKQGNYPSISKAYMR